LNIEFFAFLISSVNFVIFSPNWRDETQGHHEQIILDGEERWMKKIP